MHVLQLTVFFQLPGCQSLKEKRRRLRRLTDHFGRQAGIAVAESGAFDNRRLGQWTFVIIGNDWRVVDARSASIETYCLELDATIINSERERFT